MRIMLSGHSQNYFIENLALVTSMIPFALLFALIVASRLERRRRSACVAIAAVNAWTLSLLSQRRRSALQPRE